MRRREMLTAGATATTMTAAGPAAAAPGGGPPPPRGGRPAPPGLAKNDTLAFAAGSAVKIGCAVAGGGHHTDADYPDPFTADEPYREVLASDFTSLSAENQMKWDHLHPARGAYDFTDADAIVDFAEANGQVVRGHTLMWHNQNPAWLEEGDYSPEQLREILKDHVLTVVRRYAGRTQQWDVVNEIFDDNAELRREGNIWLRELGTEIIADCFRWAHEADPHALLFFNDYNVDGINPKSDAYYALIQDLLADDVPIHGFSTQGHLSLRYEVPGDLAENLQRFADLGLQTAITELDVRMDLPEGGEPTPEQLQTQADYFRRVTEAALSVEGCDSLTLWGVLDKYSWVPGTFPGEGTATVLWDDFTRKPAYYAVQTALAEASGRAGHPALRH